MNEISIPSLIAIGMSIGVCLTLVIVLVVELPPVDKAVDTITDRLFPPQVLFSWSTQECIEVRPSKAGSCDDLPNIYTRVWIR